MMETTTVHPPRALEDPSGRRLRRMRWVGRAVALFFLIWFVVILVGALGVGPAGRVLFGSVARLAGDPPPLHRAPTPRKPNRADLTPALPAFPAVSTAPATNPLSVRKSSTHSASAPASGHHPSAIATTHGRSAFAPGHTTRTATTPGHSASAPGHTATTGTTPGHSASAPGHTAKTGTSHGRSSSAPGHTRTTTTPTATTTTTTTATTTSHGRSGSAPGQTTKTTRRSSRHHPRHSP